MMQEHVIVWFRRDLRIEDNPALSAAARTGQPVIPLYVHAPEEEGEWAAGGACRWWLHHALASLDSALAGLGNGLVIRAGNSLAQLQDLVSSHRVNRVFWNRCYEPAAAERDRRIETELRGAGVQVAHFNASLLWEPGEVRNRSGAPFKVFTPFWKHVRTIPPPAPEPLGMKHVPASADDLVSQSLDGLGLLPEIPWDAGLAETWQPSLEGAARRLSGFARDGVRSYAGRRDLPGEEGTSRLSPYLRCGQVGPRQVWQVMHQCGAADTTDGFKFLSEIAWREFAYHLLHHFPDTPTEPLAPAFRDFPWQPDAGLLHAWQRGLTGYPVVDAGMRELWHTGWMHNRVRMIAASFLVKHLLQPWQDGARWFWDTLVDADLANNTMGWQWSAGCGADAAPYFRIFNPMLQGAKFDAGGDYVRRWIPELSRLPAQYIHQPWEAPAALLEESGIRLGVEYPLPVVEHRWARQRALDALAENKRRNQAANGG